VEQKKNKAVHFGSCPELLRESENKTKQNKTYWTQNLGDEQTKKNYHPSEENMTQEDLRFK
jgi:hypothetical protein